MLNSPPPPAGEGAFPGVFAELGGRHPVIGDQNRADWSPSPSQPGTGRCRPACRRRGTRIRLPTRHLSPTGTVPCWTLNRHGRPPPVPPRCARFAMPASAATDEGVFVRRHPLVGPQQGALAIRLQRRHRGRRGGRLPLLVRLERRAQPCRHGRLPAPASSCSAKSITAKTQHAPPVSGRLPRQHPDGLGSPCSALAWHAPTPTSDKNVQNGCGPEPQPDRWPAGHRPGTPGLAQHHGCVPSSRP